MRETHFPGGRGVLTKLELERDGSPLTAGANHGIARELEGRLDMGTAGGCARGPRLVAQGMSLKGLVWKGRGGQLRILSFKGFPDSVAPDFMLLGLVLLVSRPQPGHLLFQGGLSFLEKKEGNNRERKRERV